MSMSKFLEDNKDKSPDEMADAFLANVKNAPTVLPEDGDDEGDGDEGDEEPDDSSDEEEQQDDAGTEEDGDSEEEGGDAGDEEDGSDDSEGSDDNSAEETSKDGETSEDAGKYLEEIYSHLGVSAEDAPNPGMMPIKRGKEYEWYTPKEYANMAMKGVDYTKKTMELKKYKDQLEVLGEVDINDNDIELIKIVKSGDIKKAMTLISKSAGKDSEQFYQEAIDIDEDYYNNTDFTSMQQQQQGPVVHHEVQRYFVSLPDSTKMKIKELDDTGLVPDAFIKGIMSSPENFNYYVDDVENGVAQQVVRLAFKKINGMTEFEQNKYLNNANEYIKLYKSCTDELNEGASQPTPKKNPKKVNPDTVKKNNRQNFRKSHNRSGSVRKQVKQDVHRTAADIVNDPEALAEAQKKYGIDIK